MPVISNLSKEVFVIKDSRTVIMRVRWFVPYQGRSQKFVLGGISFFGGIKLLNSRSDVIFTP